MYKKIMLSAAAAMTLTTAGMAFDTAHYDASNKKIGDNANGIIVTNDDLNNSNVYLSKYTGGGLSYKLNKSTTQYGDALIYPAFNTTSGWESEFTVRNTLKNRSVIAKVVVYDGENSEEIFDFNIYLSDEDVFTFKIKDGMVTTSDESTPMSVSAASDNNDTVTMNTTTDFNFGKTSVLKTIKGKTVINGYVAIYGMAQEDQLLDEDGVADFNTDSSKYHQKHDLLWTDYRKALDECRDGWRDVYTEAGMIHGMMISAVNGPNISSTQEPLKNLNNHANSLTGTCYSSVEHNSSTVANAWGFTDVDFDALVGSVRISNSGDASRDMMLPATAVENFTDDDRVMLWAEGEYASIADRQMVTNYYSAIHVKNDAMDFIVNTINFEFDKNRDSETKVLLTQPFKRTLVQLQTATTSNYSGYSVPTNITSANLYTADYGQFTVDIRPFDRAENTAVVSNEGVLVSPYSGTDPKKYNKELQEMTLSDLMASSVAQGFDPDAGHVFIEPKTIISGIVTQMNGGESTGDAQTNWTYAPAK